ncbi:hypothetical protein CK203_065177 [Vitis vinifera]|uniref:Uncharacterized protein n=1 Tax=Vitis vinifera TaxID=29760 RepID=A0A438G2D8_VITVI|nr:hypothetical protein CK203_065177 [Vitis vinifera]
MPTSSLSGEGHGGTPPIIRVIQGGPVDEHWDSKHHWQAISQERSDVEKIGMEQYSFVLGTMEPIDGVISFGPRDLT